MHAVKVSHSTQEARTWPKEDIHPGKFSGQTRNVGVGPHKGVQQGAKPVHDQRDQGSVLAHEEDAVLQHDDVQELDDVRDVQCGKQVAQGAATPRELVLAEGKLQAQVPLRDLRGKRHTKQRD